MARVSGSIEIAAPRTVVWDKMNEMERWPDWIAFTDRMVEIPDEIGVGSTYKEYGGPGKMKSESEWVITEFQPHSRQVHIGDLGPMKPEITMTFEDSGEGTLLQQMIEFRMFPRFRPLGSLLEILFVKRLMQSGLNETMDGFKKFVESG